VQKDLVKLVIDFITTVPISADAPPPTNQSYISPKRALAVVGSSIAANEEW